MRDSLETAKPLSYWSTRECLMYADQLQIDYSDLVKQKLIKTKEKAEEIRPCSDSSCHEVYKSLLPPSYKIEVKVSDIATLIKIQLVNTTSVLELKHYLHTVFNQPEETKQTLCLADNVMEDKKTLMSYFGYLPTVSVHLTRSIDVQFLYNGEESSVRVLETAQSHELFSSICAQQNINPMLTQLSFAGDYIDGLDMPISLLGIRNNSMVEVLDLCWNETSLPDSFFFDLDSELLML